MRLKLFLTLLLAAIIPAFAQGDASRLQVTGLVISEVDNSPIAGAVVTTVENNAKAVTDPDGIFVLNSSTPITKVIVTNPGYQAQVVDVVAGKNVVKMPSSESYFDDDTEIMFDEAMIEDEEGNSQTLNTLTSASDDVFYSTASYNFGPMYFRYRGYDSQYQSVYINGVNFNDVIRGRFNFSSLLGMTSRAFRSKTTTIGMGASDFGFGDVGGAVNYSTFASGYAPGFNGSVAYTNSNYKFRAMAQYSTGLMSNGWAFSIVGIGRYSDEGVVEGTFYNSGGLFVAAEKQLNNRHSLALTAFGGPTQRANAGATYQEAYDLMGSNLYNPNWGWQDGKKRSSRIIESFDPTVMFNWLYKTNNTKVNTGVAARWVNYSSSALNWRYANDPTPTYYKNLPYYWYLNDNISQGDYMRDQWLNNPAMSQLDWDMMYQTNYLTNLNNANLPEGERLGANYIQENRHSNQFNTAVNSYFNHRINDNLSVQGGVSGTYTRAHWYKTIRDLLGGDFWIDVDPFSDRDITLDPELLQNDLDNPNRRVGTGDKFGYNYYVNAYRLSAWVQNQITLPQWELNYGLKIGYTQYQRDGKMRNGRSPQNSLGKGLKHKFDEGAIKIGAVYKADGHNYLAAHGEYATEAPLVETIYISPRIKDDAVANPQSQRILSADLSYGWNYRSFRGAITGFYTMMENVIERSAFYDDTYGCFTNYVLSGVKREYKGVELGASYRLTPSLTLTGAATYSRFQYKNNPQGTRSFENGMYSDTTQTVYLKNYYLGSVPQYSANIGIDWAAPKNWYFNVNCTWQGDAYVNLSPVYHEANPLIYTASPGFETVEQEENWLRNFAASFSSQDKLKDAFTLNFSIGKAIYINRKISLNFNLNVNNVLNNKNVVTYAYQQGRIDTNNYDRARYPNRYTYAQGCRVFFNAGVRF